MQIDPTVDNEYKIALPHPPAVFTVYVTPRFWIVYHVLPDQVIHIDEHRARIRRPTPW